MGIANKLMFWKKEEPDFEPLDKGAEPGPDLGMQRDTGLGSDMLGMNQDPLSQVRHSADTNVPSSFQELGQQSSMQYPSSTGISTTMQKDIEILSAKIDAIRAAIESVNQRVINIENIAKGEQEKQQRARW